MTSIAYAMGQGAGAGAPQGGGFGTLVPLILMFAIFYFLLIRPQQKKQKEHRDMVAAIKPGDRVVTSGGVHGTITRVDEATVGVEIADKVRIKVQRGNIAAVLSSNPQAQKKADKDKAEKKDKSPEAKNGDSDTEAS